MKLSYTNPKKFDMGIAVGNAIGVPFQGGSQSWESYWATLVLATVDSDNPADILLTFSEAGSGLTASDFTVAGYTVSSLSYDITGTVITLTCSANVLGTTVVLNKIAGLTPHNVIVELARNTDVVLSSGYYTVSVPESPLGILTASTGRTYLNRNNLSKIRQNGSITKVKLFLTNTSDILEVFIDVWRKDGTTYDRIIHSDITSLIADGINVITLPTPVSVLEGDFVGISGKQDAGTAASMGVQSQTNGIWYVNGYPSGTDYNWAGLSSSWSNYVPIQTYMQAPLIVGIGDSLIAGHNANYSNIENSITVDLDGHILAQLALINSKYVFQNMGIGSTSSTTNAARFTADVISLKPKIALIGGFMSGLIQSENQATMIANLTTMLDASVAAGIVPIVCKINPWTNGTNEQMQTRDTIMAAAQILTATYPSAVWVDFDTAIGEFRVGGDAGNLWDIQAAYNGDGVHLNQAGYAKMAEVINTAILTKYTLA